MADQDTDAKPDFMAEREIVERIAGEVTQDADVSDTNAMADLDMLESAKPRGEESGMVDPMTAADLMQLPRDGFFSALSVILIPGELRANRRRLAAVSRPFAFVTKVGKERLAVIAPPRYVTDFASIPNWATVFISPFGKHAEAAVIHDWLYAIGDVGDSKGRRRADRAFSIALKKLDVKPLRRCFMYLAVRLGGGAAYGTAGEFNFRRLKDLTPLNPPPLRKPLLRTVAVQSLKKPKKT
ncbi:MAG: DUF1353 domain-containing protein [Pseudomonadota bacterium]